MIFGGTAIRQGIFRVNPATGAGTLIGLTGQNFVGDLAFRPVAAPPAALDLNQHGLTGSWYEPATSGQGVEVEVFPNLSVREPARCRSAGSPTTPARSAAPNGSAGTRRAATSPPARRAPRSPSIRTSAATSTPRRSPPRTQVGTATLSFTACDQGQLDYTFSDGTGRSGSIPLTRLTQNVTCSTTSARSVNADFALSGNWYDPATSGQGITVEINPLSPSAFFAWYTYAPGGAAAGAAGQRWYTGQSTYTAGARTLAMTLYETTGGLFDAPTTPPPNTVAVGTATLAFQSCSRGDAGLHLHRRQQRRRERHHRAVPRRTGPARVRDVTGDGDGAHKSPFNR